MKTQYFRRPKAALTPLQGIILALVVGVLALLFLIRLVAPSVFVSIMTPLWQAGDFFAGSVSLPEDAQALSERVAALEAENNALTAHNRLLKAGIVPDESEGIRAGVRVRPPVTPYDVLIISKGTADGVYEGMQVFSKGIPVGTVESVSSDSARVVLYSASGVETEGWVGENRFPITLRGIGAGAFDADIARDALVAVGDAVYLAGSSAIPVGVILASESQPSSPRALLRIRPYANPFTMTEVDVRAVPAL